VATRDLSGSKYVTVSLVPRYICMILKELETKGDSDTIFCSKLRLHLRTEVEKQFGWILEDTTDKNIYLLASCVDPRYGALEFLQSSDQKDAIWNTLFSNIKEMNLYGTEEEKKLRMTLE
jgi:hypothetical protein